MKKIIALIVLTISIVEHKTQPGIAKTLTFTVNAHHYCSATQFKCCAAANSVDAGRGVEVAGYGSYLLTLSASAGWGRSQIESPVDSTYNPFINQNIASGGNLCYHRLSCRSQFELHYI